MHRRTKIVCTIGPAVRSMEKILELIDAGMNVARLNFSHGDHAEHLEVIKILKKARAKRKIALAIMLDTKGPEIRVGKIKDGKMSVGPGQKLLLVKQKIEGDLHAIQVTPPVALENLKKGTSVLFADGYVISKVMRKTARGIEVEIQNEGVIKTQNNVNIPGANIDLPAMTENDVRDITFGCEQDVDIIAASFIRSAEHVLEIKRLLVEQGKPEILVLAKIENSLGVEHFDAIVQVADGIMVARGDLGVELPLKMVPQLQKMMIRKSYHAAKPVVVATQMLESMIKNPRPTRAEVSDVANAIFDSASAVMLSGETAVGQYPVETVHMMKGIIEEAEKDFDYPAFFEHHARSDYNDLSSSVSIAAVKTAYGAGAKAIFACTNSGSTARLISRFRPQMPIVALTPNHKTYHQLALYWGVYPLVPFQVHSVQEALTRASCMAMQEDLVHYGDLIVLTAGAPFGVSGTTNMMIVESIGDVLVRGQKGDGKQIHGKVFFALSEATKLSEVRQRIVVLSHCDEYHLAFLKHARGIILQNHPDDHLSEERVLKLSRAFHIPLVLRADGALSLLKEGQLVTLDPEKGLIYKGSVKSEEQMLQTVCLARNESSICE